MNNDHEAHRPACASSRTPVTADDVDQAVQLALATLESAVDADWSVPAGELARLFPEVPRDGVALDRAGRADQADQWTNLLLAAGRVELPGRPRRVFEQWHSAPLVQGS